MEDKKFYVDGTVETRVQTRIFPNTVIEARQKISYLRTLTEMFGDLHLAGDYIIIFTVRREASDVLCSSSVQGHISNNFNNFLNTQEWRDKPLETLQDKESDRKLVLYDLRDLKPEKFSYNCM